MHKGSWLVMPQISVCNWHQNKSRLSTTIVTFVSHYNRGGYYNRDFKYNTIEWVLQILEEVIKDTVESAVSMNGTT